MKNLFASLLLAVLLVQLAGCASPTPAPATAVLPTNTSIPKPTATLEPTPVPTPTLEPTPFVAAETIQKIDDFIGSITVGQQKFNGIALVAYQGNIILHKGYGLIDRQDSVPFSTDKIMLLGDVGIVNSGILLLNDEGKLSMEDSICLFISECPETWQPIKVSDVLHQRTGIPNPFANLSPVATDELWSRPDRNDEVINLVRDQPLEKITTPGTALLSPANQSIKVKIIEAASGESAQDYLTKTLLKPLGITTIGEEYPATAFPKGYANYGLPVEHDPLPENMTFPNFVAGTVADFYLLFQEFLAPKILSEAAVEQIWQEDIIYFPLYHYQISVNLLGVTKDMYAPFPEETGAWDIYSYTEGYGFNFLISPKNQLVIILSSNEKDRDYLMAMKIILGWLTE